MVEQTLFILTSISNKECAHEFTRLFMESLLRSSSHGKGKLDKAYFKIFVFSMSLWW